MKALDQMKTIDALLLLLAVLVWPVSAVADDKCQPEKLQLDKVETAQVHLRERLTVHLAGLAGSCNVNGYRLRLDGYTFSNVPESDNQQSQQISFLLERNDADRAGWTRILGSPPLSGSKQVNVSLELPDKSVLPHAGDSLPRVSFVIFSPWQVAAALFVVLALLRILFVMGRGTGLLRDVDPRVEEPTQRTFSLGRCQMAFWLILLTGGFIVIWVCTGDYLGILTPQSLVLLGISGATALSSVSIDATKSAAGTIPAIKLEHKTFWNDILTDVNGPALQRLQVVVWTFILGILSVVSIYQNFSLPPFDDTLLAMVGISSGLYVGFKWPEKPS